MIPTIFVAYVNVAGKLYPAADVHLGLERVRFVPFTEAADDDGGECPACGEPVDSSAG